MAVLQNRRSERVIQRDPIRRGESLHSLFGKTLWLESLLVIERS